MASLLDMRTLLPTTLALLSSAALFGQFPGLTLPPSGGNQKASVSQFIGPVKATIEYSSPAVKDRRGQIWGKLVPYGMSNLGFGNGKPDPWRAGANQNTTFEVSDNVVIEGKPLPAGRYGLHMIPGQAEWTIIFSKNSDAWGSFWYEESEDALRVNVKPHKHEFREYLTYEFPVRKPAETTVEMQWEELAVPWTIRVADPDEIYVARLGRELTSQPGFSWQGYLAAAQYTIQANKHLDQGLKWAEAAISMPFIGQKNFQTMSVKAQILAKTGQAAESRKIMDTAMKLPGTSPGEIHMYGRQLLTDKQVDEALQVFQFNAQKNGDAWPVHVGLARAYMAKGDLPQALEHARKAAAQAPDDLNRKNLEKMVEALAQGKTYDQ